jgi:hypothetical protein
MRADRTSSPCRADTEELNAEDDAADRAIAPEPERQEACECSCGDTRVDPEIGLAGTRRPYWIQYEVLWTGHRVKLACHCGTRGSVRAVGRPGLDRKCREQRNGGGDCQALQVESHLAFHLLLLSSTSTLRRRIRAAGRETVEAESRPRRFRVDT